MATYLGPVQFEERIADWVYMNRRIVMVFLGGLLASSTVLAVLMSKSEPSAGSDAVVLEFDGQCLNPGLWIDESNWSPVGLIPTALVIEGTPSEFTGTFTYEDQDGLFEGSGLTLQYQRRTQINMWGCLIFPDR